MSNLLAVFVTFAILVIFPVFIFYLLVRAIRDTKTRWWGIIILLAILTCYCSTMVGIAGLLYGGNATGTVPMEHRYCSEFREALTQTETLPDAVARMDAASASDEYRVGEPDKNLRFRYVWLLGGCFLFAGANLMMFGPGRREKRHPADCIVMIIAALVVFLTGIWQVAWGNGYAFQAGVYHRMLTGWHTDIHWDAVHASNAEIAAKLNDDVKSLNGLRLLFLELSGEKIPGKPAQNKVGEKDAAPGGIAIIGGADGPTAVFIGSELLKKQADAPAESGEEKDSPANGTAAEETAEETAAALDAD